MAGALAQQGKIEEAMGLWRESVEITEQIGDVKGKAATLANMAWAAGQADDSAEELKLNREAARLLADASAWTDLITVLGNMGGSYLNQSMWLAMRAYCPAEDLLNLGDDALCPLAEDRRLLDLDAGVAFGRLDRFDLFDLFDLFVFGHRR